MFEENLVESTVPESVLFESIDNGKDGRHHGIGLSAISILSKGSIPLLRMVFHSSSVSTEKSRYHYQRGTRR
jgi:hypothetical protein